MFVPVPTATNKLFVELNETLEPRVVKIVDPKPSHVEPLDEYANVLVPSPVATNILLP